MGEWIGQWVDVWMGGWVSDGWVYGWLAEWARLLCDSEVFVRLAEGAGLLCDSEVFVAGRRQPAIPTTFNHTFHTWGVPRLYTNPPPTRDDLRSRLAERRAEIRVCAWEICVCAWET